MIDEMNWMNGTKEWIKRMNERWNTHEINEQNGRTMSNK